MIKKLLITLSISALSLASAQTYKIKLYQDSYLEENLLKRGEYKLELNESKVVLSRGKQSVEAQAKVESVDKKFASTSIRFGGNYHIREIRIGGTTTKLVFEK
jgi:hypothetical protein